MRLPRGDANTIVDPKGGSAPLPIPSLGNAMVGLEFDDQSILIPCSPLGEPRFNCNYLQGGGEGLGTMTGELNASLNPAFEGKSPRGHLEARLAGRRLRRSDDDARQREAVGQVRAEGEVSRLFFAQSAA